MNLIVESIHRLIERYIFSLSINIYRPIMKVKKCYFICPACESLILVNDSETPHHKERVECPHCNNASDHDWINKIRIIGKVAPDTTILEQGSFGGIRNGVVYFVRWLNKAKTKHTILSFHVKEIKKMQKFLDQLVNVCDSATIQPVSSIIG